MRVRGSDRFQHCVLPGDAAVTGFDAFLSTPQIVQSNWVGPASSTQVRMRVFSHDTLFEGWTATVDISTDFLQFDLGEDWGGGDVIDVSLECLDSCGNWVVIASDTINV